MNDAISQVTELLKELPGIGPRQARRLTLWLMRRDKTWVTGLVDAIAEARSTVKRCTLCTRLFPSGGTGDICDVCGKSGRDHSKLMVVERDVDFENIERTRAFDGRYFILGGTVSLLDKEPDKHVHIRALEQRLAKDGDIKEVILATSATTEGEDTASFLEERLAPFISTRGLSLTHLGRGLSTGTELEYVDAATMKSALLGRH